MSACQGKPKAKEHPGGTIGLSMHVLAAMQVAQTAGGMQQPGTELARIFNMGGPGVAKHCSILEVRT
ncbi:MAG: hypothetical protein CSA68_07925 [Rhodobacterales bacterium]|nr:MAG: hypothetical protein CSA68_07925 [Rhodobacterales bacterium]